MATTRRSKNGFHVPTQSDGVAGIHRRQLLKVLEDSSDRRATGSFYTPLSIVDQVVGQSVGPIIKELRRSQDEQLCRKPASDEGASDERLAKYRALRVLDPAMGCGNFLLTAAEFLFQAIRGDLAGGSNPAFGPPASRLRQSIADNCLYGVDCNPAAVAHARAALAAWAGTGVDHTALAGHLRLGNSLLTARLADVKHGVASKSISAPPAETSVEIDRLRAVADCRLTQNFDSRIGPWHLKQAQDAVRDSRAWDRMRRQRWFRRVALLARHHRFFHWELEFPDVFDAIAGTSGETGGFDAVIGNPPFVDSVAMSKLSPGERRHCARRWKSATGNWDQFVPFVELSLECARPGGYVGLVLPNKLLSVDYCAAVRRLLASRRIVSIDDYSTSRAFEDADVYPVAVVVRNRRSNKQDTISCRTMGAIPGGGFQTVRRVSTPASTLNDLPVGCWQPLLGEDADLLCAAFRDTRPLADLAHVHGAATVAEAYEISNMVRDAATCADLAKELRLVNTGAIDRYVDRWLIEPIRYLGTTHLRPVVVRQELAGQFPVRNEQANAPKIILAGLTRRLEACHDASGDVLAGKSTVIVRDTNLDQRYLLAVLNSRLMSWTYRQVFGGMSLAGGYLQVTPRQVRKLPIRDVRPATPSPERSQRCAIARKLHQESVSDASPRPMPGFVERMPAATLGDDVIYDLVIELADEMCRLSRDRQQCMAGYQRRLERQIGVTIESLTGKSVLRRFDRCTWEEAWKVLRRNLRGLPIDVNDPGLRSALRADFEQSADTTRAINRRLAITDQWIDECVFRLYGISKCRRERMASV